MKIGLFADPHVCQSSSIVRGRGDKYSYRLENLIESFKWMHQFFIDNKVDKVVCLGDLADNNYLTAEDISALSECDFLKDYEYIIGNHDISSRDGLYNVSNIYKNVYSKPTLVHNSDCDILYLPYSHNILDLKQLVTNPSNTIILSHNDIKGVNYGNIACKEGYDFSDILQSSKIFVNGHIHVGQWLVRDRIINLGTITGINFNCSGAKWDPSIGILDTNAGLSVYENPVAFVFHKWDTSDIFEVATNLGKLDKSRTHVIQLRVPNTIVDDCRAMLDASGIKFSRIISYSEFKSSSNLIKDEITVKPIAQSLVEYAKQYTDKDKYDVNMILEEIGEIFK